MTKLETHLDSPLNSFFDGLPETLKLPTGQAALSVGITQCIDGVRTAMQDEISNLEELDPGKLAAQYTMLRLQLLLLQDMKSFLEYAGAYFKNQTGAT